MNNNYSHIVEIIEEERLITIHRWTPKGRVLYTSTRIPEGKLEDHPKVFSEFLRKLGENILLDSPAGRRCLGVDE
ncbi:hypothetical protein LDO32_15875 [Luteimonas sp. Y-2-2-4F]|nr:hypothetical protein [Luteimonas sp. Y-2-2-4F]MCD9033205.1 hypothetical protein [Luteimonas sp. Y-2-2-4F]